MSTMRTRGRKQGKAEAEVEAEHAAETNSISSGSSNKGDEAAASPTTVVTISKIEGPTVARAPSAPTPPRSSKVPGPVQFPLVAVLSLALSALGQSLAWPYTKALAPYTRAFESQAEVGILLGWKVFQLALGWFGKYDGYDLAALSLLSHGPPLYLLSAFYSVPTPALLLTLGIETAATYAPFRLLRPLSTAHADPLRVPNADIVTDRPIALLTTLLAGAIYSVTLTFAYATYLPTQLVLYFNGIPSLAAAHEASYVGLLPVTLVLGFAARVFVFTPAEAVGRTEADGRAAAEFDPVAATLGETVRWNLWGWTSQTKVVVARTALLALATGVNTTLQLRLTVAGVETAGALAWAGVWVLAAILTGLGLGLVGSV